MIPKAELDLPDPKAGGTARLAAGAAHETARLAAGAGPGAGPPIPEGEIIQTRYLSIITQPLRMGINDC